MGCSPSAKHSLSSANPARPARPITRTIAPARALAAETLNPECLPNAECGVQNAECCDDLTPAEVALMWQTAPPRMPIPPTATLKVSALAKTAG
jgi:hypothetical protein